MTRILVPSGIGDIWWVLAKLPAFCRLNGVEKPELWIVDDPKRRRSLEYVEMVPFVKAWGYAPLSRFQVAYACKHFRAGAPAIVPGVLGYDYLLQFNGPLEAGLSLDDAEPELAPEWRFPLDIHPVDKIDAGDFAKEHGRYIVSCWFEHGWYGRSLETFGPREIYRALRIVADELGCSVVLCGAAWDREAGVVRRLLEMDADGILLDLTGRTSIGQYFALLDRSLGCIGHPAGNTLKATFFRKPLVCLWGDRFIPAFRRNVVPPDARYRALDARETTAEQLAEAFLNLQRSI